MSHSLGIYGKKNNETPLLFIAMTRIKELTDNIFGSAYLGAG